MVIEVVYGNALEDRFNQLLDIKRKNVKLRLVSQHIGKHKVKGTFLRQRLERLIKQNGRVVLVIDRRRYQKSKNVQEAADELEQIGVRVYIKRNIHAKIVQLETNSEKGFLLSSANLTDTALHVNKEAGIFSLNVSSDNLFDGINQFFKNILGKDY